jgi:O-methyltransferase
MKRLLTRSLQNLLGRFGYEIVRKPEATQLSDFPPDFTPEEIADYQAVEPYTLTGPLRTVSLTRAIEYLVRHNIAGDIVECGVWKGGSIMATARALLRLDDTSRRLWLFDTFAGMSAPTAEDVSVCGISAEEDHKGTYLRVGLDQVRSAVLSTGYPPEQIRFVQGKVEDTIPGQAPEQIALLRLDTDWYESTRHELIHLFPRLVRGGVIIIDDYGHWRGARKATDEYFALNNVVVLLDRIDFSARIAVKL